MATDTRPVYPGPHPGTGYNDHLHSWDEYRGGLVACRICGKPHPDQPARSAARGS